MKEVLNTKAIRKHTSPIFHRVSNAFRFSGDLGLWSLNRRPLQSQECGAQKVSAAADGGSPEHASRFSCELSAQVTSPAVATGEGAEHKEDDNHDLEKSQDSVVWLTRVASPQWKQTFV